MFLLDSEGTVASGQAKAIATTPGEPERTGKVTGGLERSGRLSPAQRKAPPGQQAPPPEQAPTNAISVNFSDVAGGLKVNVNNSSNVAGTCTYDATAPNSLIPPSHRDFTVGANAGTSFQISGIPTGTESAL